MFRPNQTCVINSTSGDSDVYGLPVPGKTYKEQCSMVKMNVMSAKSAVRADSSATRGNARELEADTIILLTKNTVAQINDTVTLLGYQFLIMSKFPRYDVMGKLDHVQIGCTYWEGT